MEAPSGNLPQIVCLLRDSLPLDQDEVSAFFDPDRFARKTNPAQEEAIASQWRRQSRANPRLFNGSKFRYAGVRWTDRPQLQLGLTSYREHVGTNLRCGQRLLQEAGAAVHGDRQAFLADPLAVGALLLTSDNRLALVRRALWVGEYPGRVDRPGGHAEPDELPAAPGHEPASDERHEAALSEVFESVRREVRDELGVPLTHLSRAYLAGILRDTDLGGRPTLEFIIRCSLPSTELERLYNEGKHCEADESLALVLLTRDELFSEQRAVFRVPDLAELEVEYPWQRPVPENGTAHPAATPAGGAEEQGTASSGETGVPAAARPSCEVGVTAAAGPSCEVGVAAVTEPSCESGTADTVVNCGAAVTSETVSNCEPAVAAATETQSKSAVAPAAVDPPNAQPPAKQPAKKKRRNRKDKKAAGRAEALQPTAKAAEADPVPAGGSLTNDISQPQPSSNQNSASDAGEAPTPCLETSSQAAPSDTHTAAADAPASSANAQASSADTQASSVADATSSVTEVPSSGAAAATEASSSDAAAEAAPEPAATDSDEIVVVQQNGVVLLQSGGEVTETTMPTSAPPSGQIETLAEVVNNPEGAEPAAADAIGAEKTPEELEREKKAELWDQMTPGCKASLILLKAANLKGFVFRF